MKILYAVSEAAPFVKTGGLGDVAGSLPEALAPVCDIRVVLPLYEKIGQEWRSRMDFVGRVGVPLAWRSQPCGVYSLLRGGVTYYFIDNEYYFKRRELYGAHDDAERFSFFCQAVLHMFPLIGFTPDILHVNDWQTAMIPIYFKLLYQKEKRYHRMKTVFTIHNIEYQGRFSKDIVKDVLGLDTGLAREGPLGFDGDVSLMKGAVCLADGVTTVSPTYAREIQTAEYGRGMQDILASHKDKLRGILNGIDTETFDPAADPFLFANYSAANPKGKEQNKKALLKMLGLPPAGKDTPVIGMVSRLVPHKGIDLVEQAIDRIASEDVRFVVIGTGDWRYEQMLANAARRYPGKISANILFSADLASKIYAGSDMLLMPSKSEPCGLSQQIAMRYGTIPVVRATGGLRDTVAPYDPATHSGSGFCFEEYTPDGMMGAVSEAVGCFRNKPAWNTLRDRGLSGDFSWKRSAAEYFKAYSDL